MPIKREKSFSLEVLLLMFILILLLYLSTRKQEITVINKIIHDSDEEKDTRGSGGSSGTGGTKTITLKNSQRRL